MRLFKAINISGQDIEILFTDYNDDTKVLLVPNGESLDGLTNKTISHLNDYRKLGLMKIYEDFGDFDHDWKKDGF